MMHFVNGWFDFYQVSFINEEFGFGYTFAFAHVTSLVAHAGGLWPGHSCPCNHTCVHTHKHTSIKHIYWGATRHL